jgi:plasmid stabilization system protein ParE
MTGYDFHPEARFDLDEIWEYIRADNIDAVDRVIAKILSAIRGLVPFPNQGHKRPDLTSQPLRFIPVREYLIAYAPEERPLWVVRDTWTAQPAYHGRDLETQRVIVKNASPASKRLLSPKRIYGRNGGREVGRNHGCNQGTDGQRASSNAQGQRIPE